MRVPLRLEALEPCALLSTDLIGPTPVPTSDVADRLFVRFAPNTPDSVIQADLAAVGGKVLQSYPNGPDLVTVSSGAARDAALGRLERDCAVLYAEPDIAVQAKAAAVYPNNPYFSVQWGLSNANGVSIDAPQSWSVTTGNPATIVAVLDTGIDLGNPAFAGRIGPIPTPRAATATPATSMAGTSSRTLRTSRTTTATARTCRGSSGRRATTGTAWPGSTGTPRSCQ